MKRPTRETGISRRSLLVGGGAGFGLLIAWAAWPRTYAPNLRAGEGENLFNAFLKIGRDGRVIVAVPQAELGQGVTTALPQILADELGADWRTIAVEPAPISPLYANLLLAGEAGRDSAFPSMLNGWASGRYAMREALMVTAGSSSVRAFERRLREAGAAARVLLCRAAGRRWGIEHDAIAAREGFVVHGRRRLSFAEIAEEAAAEPLPDYISYRGGSGSDRLIGRALPRLDAPAKIDGTAMFAADVRLPGMLFAAIRSVPESGRHGRIDARSAEPIIGALHLIERPGWVAVAGLSWWAAARALEALLPDFDVAGPADRSAIVSAMRTALEIGEAERIVELGEDVDLAGASPVSAGYRADPAPAAALEPLTATARVTPDGLEIWAASQAPSLARAAAARATGIPESSVSIYPVFGGGGYGRRFETDAIVQAALISQAIERPVQASWSRYQEIQNESWRAPAAARLTAWIGGGRIARWEARIAAPDADAALARRLRTSTSFFRPGGGPVAGAVPPYEIPAVAVDHVAADPGITCGIDRSGARAANNFFTESFIDELARAAGSEPLSFRMTMLGTNPRLARALQTAAAIGGWDGGAPGSAMGIAACSAFGSHLAALAEIEIGRDQRVRVLRAVCAVDCGRIINPELVRQQIEGGFLHGLTAALGEPAEWRGGLPAARSIGAWRLPNLRSAPEISVELIDSDEEPGGVSELAVPVAAPAIANALFALTGRRRRAIPLTIGDGR